MVKVDEFHYHGNGVEDLVPQNTHLGLKAFRLFFLLIFEFFLTESLATVRHICA